MPIILAFWLWVGKDVVSMWLPERMAAGRLVIIAFACGVLVILARRPVVRQPRRYAGTIGMLALFLLVVIFSTCLHDPTAFSIFKFQQLIISVALAAAIGYYLVHTDASENPLFLWVGLALAITGAVSLFAGPTPVDLFYGFRLRSIAHLNIQDFYVMVWLFAVSRLVQGGVRQDTLLTVILASVVCVPSVVLFGSRMIPFTVGVAVVAMLYGAGHRRASAAITVGLCLLVVALTVKSPFAESRLSTIFRQDIGQTFANDPRSVSFVAAWRNFGDAPLLGIGFGGFVYPGTPVDVSDRLSGTWPHNLELELLCETGIVGFLAYFAFFAHSLPWFPARTWSAMNLHAAFAYVLATVQFTHNLSYPLLWLMLLWSAAYRARYEQSWIREGKEDPIVQSRYRRSALSRS